MCMAWHTGRHACDLAVVVPRHPLARRTGAEPQRWRTAAGRQYGGAADRWRGAFRVLAGRDPWRAALRAAGELHHPRRRSRPRVPRCAGRARARRRVRGRGGRLDGLPRPVRPHVLATAARRRRRGAHLQSAATGPAVRLDQPRPPQAAGGGWHAGISLRRVHQREVAGRRASRRTGVALRGPVVAEMQAAFAQSWAETGAELPPFAATGDSAGGNVALRLIATQPASAGIYRLDQMIAALARKTLWLTDAYFVGTAPYVQALTAAARDGVDVRLLVPGTSDIPMVASL